MDRERRLFGIRQIKQVIQSGKYIETHITRYYNFNADIIIELRWTIPAICYQDGKRKSMN